MFNNLFKYTRNSINHIHHQLTFLMNVISLTAQSLFIGYYVYLIVINVNKLPFLITYSALLGLSVFMLLITVIFLAHRVNTRMDKRIKVERKRRITLINRIVTGLLKVAAISLSGYELTHYPCSDMQIIMFTLSIVLLVITISFTVLIELINKDIDLLRLSIDLDIQNSKILNKLIGGDKEYTDQEMRIIENIKEKR